MRRVWYSRLLTILGSLAWVLLGGLLLAGEFGREYYWLDQIAHFRGVFGLIAAIMTGACLLTRRWRLGSLMAGWVFVAIWTTFPGVPRPVDDPSEASLKLLSLNVYSRNEALDGLRQLIARESPDVVFLFETTARLDPLLEDWDKVYPYQSDRGYGAGGSVVLSKFPLLEERPPYAGFGTHPVRIRLPNAQVVDLFAVHLFSPTNRRKWRWRNDGFTILARAVNESTNPAVVAGDFNCTPYSVHFRNFLKATELLEPKVNLLPRATWLGPMPELAGTPWVGLPIDHVLTNPGATVIRAWTGPHVGSDHRPVLAEIQVHVRPDAGNRE